MKDDQAPERSVFSRNKKLEIRIGRTADGRLLIRPIGTIDLNSYELLQSVFQEAFDGGSFEIVCDCSRVDYISSSGACVFMGAVGVAAQKNGKIKVENPSKVVKEVFDLLGFSEYFA